VAGSKANVAELSVVGRESELVQMDAVLANLHSGGSLVLFGDAGIGKTTLWEAGIEAAGARGVRVLATRGASAEARLAHAGLIDLCDRVDEDVLATLRAPQRSSLEVALLRADPQAVPPEPQAVALGFLNVVRALATRSPVLVAIDDAQWLDAPSADMIGFAARRLESERVGFLLSTRGEEPAPFERVLDRRRIKRVAVGPLSFGATRRLLADRFQLSMSRALLQRVVDVTLGNPLFIVELGRALKEHGLPGNAADIPLPAGIDEMLGTRVGSLAEPVRRLLVALGLSGELTTAELASVESASVLDQAIDTGVIVMTGDRGRPSHPLLAEAARRMATPNERRKVHVALAATTADEALRAKHLALAARRPDDELAANLASAAADAAARGARQQAVELSEHAMRLTPRESAARAERLLALADHLGTAGELHRMTDLLTPQLTSIPAGAARARAWLMLSEGTGPQTMDDMARYRDNALAECTDDAELRATILAKKAANAAGSMVAGLEQAEQWATEAADAAAASSSAAQRLALYALAWTRAVRGRPVDDLCETYLNLSTEPTHVAGSPERVAAQRLVWRGEIDRAQGALAALMSVADERGEAQSYALVRLHLCELHLRAGNWEAASALLDEWAESSDRGLMFRPKYERCRALLAAGCGDSAAAELWGTQALARAEETGCRWDGLEAQRALALAAALAHETSDCTALLRAVWQHTLREGVGDPGVFPVAADLVENLLELDERAEAAVVATRLRALAEQQAHPWGLAAADQCDALVMLAESRFDAASAERLRVAAHAYEAIGLRFDSARCLLGLGRCARRLKQWGQARAALEDAVAGFEAIGSAAWADSARSQLERVGARRPRPAGELTDSERRTALLAASGRSNKEIARELVVTVHTVEVHLSRTYAKLGISSRGQLAARMTAASLKD
jgi:DNA-binding CsgD family transcriptional regulator